MKDERAQLILKTANSEDGIYGESAVDAVWTLLDIVEQLEAIIEGLEADLEEAELSADEHWAEENHLRFQLDSEREYSSELQGMLDDLEDA